MNEILDHAHPIFVHFPIAIITASVVYDLIVSIRRRSLPVKAGLWLWLVAAASAWLSVWTGPEDDARGVTSYLETHSTLANITAWLVSALVAAKLYMIIRNKHSIARIGLIAYLLVAIVSCGTVLGTGYYGGKMVYDDGVGVKVDGASVHPPKSGGRD